MSPRDDFLRREYPRGRREDLEQALGAPWWQVKRWAWALGLKRAKSPGKRLIIVKQLADKVGVDRRTMYRILRWAGIPLQPTTRSRVFCVSRQRAMRAVMDWLDCEVLSEAARRHGVPAHALYSAFQGHPYYRRPGGWRRIPSKDVAKVVLQLTTKKTGSRLST